MRLKQNTTALQAFKWQGFNEPNSKRVTDRYKHSREYATSQIFHIYENKRDNM